MEKSGFLFSSGRPACDLSAFLFLMEVISSKVYSSRTWDFLNCQRLNLQDLPRKWVSLLSRLDVLGIGLMQCLCRVCEVRGLAPPHCCSWLHPLDNGRVRTLLFFTEKFFPIIRWWRAKGGGEDVKAVMCGWHIEKILGLTSGHPTVSDKNKSEWEYDREMSLWWGLPFLACSPLNIH